MTDLSEVRRELQSIPHVSLGHLPSPIDELARLRDAIGLEAALLAKRDDAIAFGFGGNKVRKLTLVAAQALAEGADTLITCGGVQSNHCRATAAVAARLGLACHIVANGLRPERPTGNALLVSLFGADVTYVGSRDERATTMERVARNLRAAGRKPLVIPLGASTPLGGMAIALGVREIVAQHVVPDVIVHASSSGGTQAGLMLGCALWSPHTRVIGVSADDAAADIQRTVLGILDDAGTMLGVGSRLWDEPEVDDSMIGGGYGVPTSESREAQALTARLEAIVTDHWYTAKAMAGLIARARRGEFDGMKTVLFWHTGGQPSVLG